jgi:hypothetical protein
MQPIPQPPPREAAAPRTEYPSFPTTSLKQNPPDYVLPDVDLPTPRIHQYRNRRLDPHTPTLLMSPILNLPSGRPRRKLRTTSIDPFPENTYGDVILQKEPKSTRLFFQNVKGLTHTTCSADYHYFMSCMSAYQVDVVGLAETNTCWSHTHLQSDLRSSARKHFRQTRVAFASPEPEIDKCHEKETFQAGGSLTVATTSTVPFAYGSDLKDASGLGRWSGMTFRGKGQTYVSIITAYRTCTGSIRCSPLGSTFVREHEHFRQQGLKNPNPRRLFFTDLSEYISTVTDSNSADHSLILMLDANSVLSEDQPFQEFISKHGLFDMHARDPAPSTYMGAAARRIDYILGSSKVASACNRAGTLSYHEGPQSDHRALYVDIALHHIFDPDFISTQPALNNRNLYTGNPELVDSYLQQMKKYYEHHSMYERIQYLSQHHQELTKAEVRVLLEKWDLDQGRAMKASERQLKRPTKPYQWSPKLRNAGITLRYWKLRLREIQFHEDYGPTFH